MPRQTAARLAAVDPGDPERSLGDGNERGPRLATARRTNEFLARHIRDTFARAGLQHLTRLRTNGCACNGPRSLDTLGAIITAVLGVVCPPTAVFSAILEPVIAAIIKVLFRA